MISLLNTWGAAWVGWFVPMLIQDTIYLGPVFLALYLLRDAPARIRAGVAALGVLKLAVPPFLPLKLTGPVSWAQGDPTAATLLFPFVEPSTAPSGWTAVTGGLTLPAALLLVWSSIVLARLGWVGLQTFQLAWAVRGATLLPADEIPAEVSHRGINVRRTPAIGLPLTLGPWPRTIYVPADWETWRQDHRAAALRHELAHITRRDGLFQAVELVVQAVWFFHPLVLLLVRRLRTWREMACDDAAVTPDAASRLEYSRFLAELAGRAPVPALTTGSASTLFQGEGELLSRISHQIREVTMRNISTKRVIFVTGVLVLAILPLSLVLAQAPPPPVATPTPAGHDEILVTTTPPPKRPHVRVGMQESRLTVNGAVVSTRVFPEVLQDTAAAAGENPLVILDADGGVAMGRLHDVQDELRKAELTDIVYAGDTGRKLAMSMPSADAWDRLKSLPENLVMRVAVDGAGVLTVGGEQISGQKLSSVVAEAIDREPKLVVALHTSRETRYGAFVQVLDSLKQGGATRIAILDPER